MSSCPTAHGFQYWHWRRRPGFFDTVYGRRPRELATAIEMLLSHEHLVIEDADAVARALAQFRARPALGFSDCLMVEVARKAGHLLLGTFDRALARTDGVQKL